MLEDWSDYLSKFWNCTFGIIGICFNIFLIVVIQKHTPGHLKVYSTVIRLAAICDTVISFAAFMVSARVYSSGVSFVMMFQGPARFLIPNKELAPHICLCLFICQTHGYILRLFVLLFSLYYRRHTVINPLSQIKQKTVNLICYGFSSFFVSYILFIIYNSIEPMEKINELIKVVRPELINSTWTYYALLDLTVFPHFISEGLVWCMTFIVLSSAIYCRHSVQQALTKITMSPTLLEIQKSLMKLLLIQVLAPLTELVIVILYLITLSNNTWQIPLIENVLEFMFSFFPAMSPILTFYFVGPYRKVLKDMMFTNVSRVASIPPLNNAPTVDVHESL